MTAIPPSPSEDSDLHLVERTVAGDQRAYELLVIKYQRRIERLIGRMVRDTDLIQDIAQETFIRAYRALHQFRGEAQFYTWLYRIAVNTAKKALMDMKRNPVISENALRGNDEEDETSRLGHELTSEETPETVLAAREIAQAVNAAMEALPSRKPRSRPQVNVTSPGVGNSLTALIQVSTCSVVVLGFRVKRTTWRIMAPSSR